jgi:hypothetical protein
METNVHIHTLIKIYAIPDMHNTSQIQGDTFRKVTDTMDIPWVGGGGGYNLTIQENSRS